MTHSIRIDYDVEMKTRDGIMLRADVSAPTSRPRCRPSWLARPTTRAASFRCTLLPALIAAKAGYAYVIQDIRGRSRPTANGTSRTSPRRTSMTATTPSSGWRRAWCDGNVGMTGGSYVAETQLAAAMANPPHLGCIAPSLMGAGGGASSRTGAWLRQLLEPFPEQLSSAGEARPARQAGVRARRSARTARWLTGRGDGRTCSSTTWTAAASPIASSAAPRCGGATRWSRRSRPVAVPVFLLSLKAGGTGLNLTRADHVVHVDRWWNPAVEEQATNRARRVEQTPPVQVLQMVAPGTVRGAASTSCSDANAPWPTRCWPTARRP